MPNLHKIGLEPIVDENSRILILGTLPGDESLRLNRYYVDPRNQFWYVLSRIYQEEIDSNHGSRLYFLRGRGIALWDVLKFAKRKGSLDSEIEDEKPNDFVSLFNRYPQIDAIGFNGKKAENLFYKHCGSTVGSIVSRMRKKVLPSTSSTPGKYVKSLDEKVHIWKEFMTGS